MKTNEMKNEKAITLIALIVTIIVLLILAGVSIAVLTGENGIINRTTEAKTASAIAQFKEDARLEHLAQQVDKHAYGTALSYSKLINKLKKKGYTIVQPPSESNQTIDSITLSANEGKVQPEETISVDVDIQYAVTGEDGYYLYIEGKYYALSQSNTNGLEVANNPSDVDLSGGTQENETITAISSDSNVATTSVSGKTIAITGVAGTTKGETATITIQVNNENFENNTVEIKILALSNLDSVNVAELTTDGASLLTATLTDGNIATSEDVKWSIKNASDANKLSVTKNGIIKCGTETTGDTAVTVVCTGANKSIEIPVISLAKIVYTNSESVNTTITGATNGFAYNNPIIPVGFSAIDTENAKWNLSADKTTASPQYNNGLVIMDEKGNQFVWVPVGEPNDDSSKVINYEKWCTKGIPYNYEDILENDELPTNTIDTTINYGGFWIGRYEAGLDVDLVDSEGVSQAQKNANLTYRNVLFEPIIVEGASPWNYISYSKAKSNAESIYTNTTYLQSGLVNGTQFDTVMKFIKEYGNKDVEEYKAWGNYEWREVNPLDRYPWISKYLRSGDEGAGGEWKKGTVKAGGYYCAHLIRTRCGFK